MKNLLLIYCMLLTCYVALSQTTITLDSTILEERELAIGVNVPWEILWGPDDHIWFTEKAGKVKRLDPETGFITEILNITNKVESGAEPGLLGMVLAPDFENNPSVYLAYTYFQGGDFERLVRYTWDGSNLQNEEIILDNIAAGGIHNGSRLLITPEGKILMTTGDVGSGNLSQDLSSNNGKLLRINPDGSIPNDNPDPNSYIYSFGHRNAQGLTYGPNGLLYSSEHGAQASDEFNVIEVNRNYGWPNVQGECNTNSEMNFCANNNVREPLKEWTPCVAVNDIAYYNHPNIPEWNGKMLMAVLGGFVQRPRISVLTLSADGLAVEEEEEYFNNYGRIRDICINPYTGAIYFATNGDFYPSSGPNKIIEYFPKELSGASLITVFPNPISSGENISLRVDKSLVDATYEVINYDGKVWLTGKTTFQTLIDTDGMPSGNYYIKVSNEEGFLSQKIVLQ